MRISKGKMPRPNYSQTTVRIQYLAGIIKITLKIDKPAVLILSVEPTNTCKQNKEEEVRKLNHRIIH